jgi:hypothetical protein
MKLQAVTVSVNYADFLEVVIPENKSLFDKWVIVTDTKDTATKELCDQHGLICVQTDSFYDNGAIFNKWAGLNEGLNLIDEDAWVAILDGDIVLHNQTKYVLKKLNLDPTFIYGIDRLDCVGFERWDKYKESSSVLRENWLLHSAGLPISARLVHLYGGKEDKGKFIGYRPLGYFQLTHRSSFDKYPQNSISADHCDLMFAGEYPREKRALIPELFCVHLISDEARKGQNWKGRKTKPFRLAHHGNEILGRQVIIEEEKKSPVLIEEQDDNITFNQEQEFKDISEIISFERKKFFALVIIRRLFKRLFRFLFWILKFIFRFFCGRKHYY